MQTNVRFTDFLPDKFDKNNIVKEEDDNVWHINILNISFSVIK